jgi:hypothetical protein
MPHWIYYKLAYMNRIVILLLGLFGLFGWSICQANPHGDDGLLETFSEILQVPINFATADEEEKSRVSR